MIKVDLNFIRANLCFVWGYYDYPISGIIKISSHYFTFQIEECPQWFLNGKVDEDGDPDYDTTLGSYSLKSIGKIQALYYIIQHSLFKFCVYNKHMGCLDGPKQPSLTKFARKMANKKSDTVHSFLWGMYFPVGMQTNPII